MPNTSGQLAFQVLDAGADAVVGSAVHAPWSIGERSQRRGLTAKLKPQFACFEVQPRMLALGLAGIHRVAETGAAEVAVIPVPRYEVAEAVHAFAGFGLPCHP